MSEYIRRELQNSTTSFKKIDNLEKFSDSCANINTDLMYEKVMTEEIDVCLGDVDTDLMYERVMSGEIDECFGDINTNLMDDNVVTTPEVQTESAKQ